MIGVGIKYILDDKEFRNKIRSSNREAEKLTRTNRTHLKTIKNINTQEKRSINTKKRELSLINKQTRALEKQDRIMKKSSRTRMVAGGRMVGGGMMDMLRGALPMMGIAGAGYALKNAYKGAASRQSGWTQVSNMLGGDISGATKQDVKDIAVMTAQDNKDVITAYYDALSAGFSEEAGKAVTKAAGIFATGGNFDIATAQSALLTTMETFKDLDANQVINLLAGTVKAGRVNERQVATNVGQFMASGNSLGIGAKEQLAAFAGISKSLGNADEAGTALGALFTALQKSTPAALKMGVDAQLVKEKGLQGVFDKMNQMLQGKSANEKAKMTSEIFGNVRAKKALFGFLENPNSLKQLGGVVESGNAMDNFARASNDAERQIVRLSSSWQQLSDKFIESTGILDGFADSLKVLSVLLGYMNKEGDVKEVNQIEKSSTSPDYVLSAKKNIYEGNYSQRDLATVTAANQGGNMLPDMAGEKFVNDYNKNYGGNMGFFKLMKQVGPKDAYDLRKQVMLRDYQGVEDELNEIFSEEIKENSKGLMEALGSMTRAFLDSANTIKELQVTDPEKLERNGLSLM